MTETTPIQRLFLGMSLLVFTSMILFHYGVQKPRYSLHPSQNFKQSSLLENSVVERDGNNNSNNNASEPLVFIAEENYIINQIINTDMDAESALTVSYQQARLANCTSRLCEINFGRVTPLMKGDISSPCSGISDCITVIIKTENRLQSTIRLVNDILNYYPSMNIVVIDDVNQTFTRDQTWNKLLSESESVTYLQVIPGVSSGRDLGLRVATTPYILLLEDDFLFTKNTNIRKMLSVLKSSDISVVAGTVGTPWSFEGAIKMYTNRTGAHLRHYPAVYYEAVPGFVNCYVVDVVKSFMLMRKRDVVNIPLWDKRRPLFEHMDFAINTRLHRRKIAYCPGIMTEHLTSDDETKTNKYLPYISTYRQLFLLKWNLASFHVCPRDSYLRFSPSCKLRHGHTLKRDS